MSERDKIGSDLPNNLNIGRDREVESTPRPQSITGLAVAVCCRRGFHPVPCVQPVHNERSYTIIKDT